MMDVFIDLEETVIDAWGKNPIFLRKCGAIQLLLKIMKDLGKLELVRIFSFAVHTPEEEAEFKTFLQEDLENRLGVSIAEVIPVRRMFGASQKVQLCHFDDLSDFILMRGKEGAFHDWCHTNQVARVSLLIDDMVPNRVTFDSDTSTTIRTVNVDSLSKTGWQKHVGL